LSLKVFLTDVHFTLVETPAAGIRLLSKATIQALALQLAVWGISCLVLLPSPCNDIENLSFTVT